MARTALADADKSFSSDITDNTITPPREGSTQSRVYGRIGNPFGEGKRTDRGQTGGVGGKYLFSNINTLSIAIVPVYRVLLTLTEQQNAPRMMRLNETFAETDDDEDSE